LNHPLHYALQETIAKIDNLLNLQVNRILHHPTFQKLEASWRGLYFLVFSIAKLNHTNLKIKVLNLHWDILSKDLMRATEFDQSHLFKLIYNEEFGSPGGEPYGLLIGDYAISHRTQKKSFYSDLAVLSNISKIAAAAFSPFITTPSPSLFGLDNFSGLERDLNLERMFQQREYIAWKALRQEEETRFIGIILPRLLQRLPFKKGKFLKDFCAFDFNETIESNQDYLWGNPCYAFATNVARTFSQSGWFADIRGTTQSSLQGGTLEDTPQYYFNNDSQQSSPSFITEATLIEQQEKNLCDFGFISLCHCKYTSFHTFYHCPSLHDKKIHDKIISNTNEKLSSMLNYVLCASRFSHYLKMITRNKIGSLVRARDCEKALNDWLRQYTASGTDLSTALQAKYPLREAKVKVSENPYYAGSYICTIHLSPHYRFEQIEAFLQLTTEIH
jgi:type VI secretion system protein ImpD